MSTDPSNAGPPDGRERRSPNRMPDTDWLTGLSSRAAFARQVTQADQDRDQFAVAIIGLRHIDEINRHLGFATGDDLLRVVGRALADRLAVGTTVARLGGAQFGLMTIGPASEDVAEWIEPMVSALDAAIAAWILEQIDFNGTCPFEPQLTVGAAGGYSGRVWADAAIALDVCESELNGTGNTVAIHDRNDSRFLAIQAVQELNDAVDRGLSSDGIRCLFQPVEGQSGRETEPPWFRIAATTSDQTTGVVDLGALRRAVGLRLERHLIGAAAASIESRGNGVLISVPLRWSLVSGQGLDYWLTPALSRHGVPADRLLFECAESTIAEGGDHAMSLLGQLIQQGSDLVVSECSGGAQTAAVLDAVPARFLRPPIGLLARAESGSRSAGRVLRGIVDLAADCGGAVILPHRSRSGRQPHTDSLDRVDGYREREPFADTIDRR